MYGPYTGTCFSSTRETDIEHVVAAREAYDSGLFAADPETRNGRITCADARRRGISLLVRSHPAYRSMRDGDGDRIVW